MSSDSQANRDPLAEVPDEVRQELQERLNGEPLLTVLRADLTLDGQFGESWVAVTPFRLIVLSPNGEGQEILFTELDDLKVEAYVGNAYLYAQVNGKRVPIARFTHSRRVDFECLAQAFQRYKTQGLPELRWEEPEPTIRRPGFLSGRRGRCPKCNQPLPPWTDVCPFCLQKTKVLKRMLTFVKPYWFAAVGGFILLVLIQLTDLVQPLLMRFTVDEALLKKNFHNLIVVVVAVLGLNFLGAVLSGGRSYLMAWLGERIVMDIRRRLYEHLHLLSLRFFDQEQTGRLVSRVANDTGQLQDFLTEGLQDILRDIFMLLFVGVVMFMMHWKLALATLLPVPILIWLANRFSQRVRRLWHMVWRRFARIHAILADTIPGARVVKAFGQERYEVRRFSDALDSHFRATMRAARLWTVFFPSVGFTTSIGFLVVWGYGGYLVIKGDLSLGSMMAFIGYLWRFYAPIQNLTRLTHRLQRAATAAERVFEILDTQPEIQDAPDAIELDEVKGHIVFEGVSFSYDGINKALKNISFEVQPGEMIGLVGPSGAGKSTLISLILRFYDPQEGRILLDGVDLRKIKLASLRKHIGVVLQETYLFNGTIAENIAYSKPDADLEEIIAAAKVANAHEFILKQPDAYDTYIGERGGRLAGGERQRLAIARAILKDPAVLIFDEATSNVDTETEAKIREAIDNLVRGRTTIAIAHRFSTLQNARRLIVLDKGELVEQGTPEELMEKDGVFARLCRMQAELSKVWAW
ncbi:ATP-binding cassette, subfamily B [Candidatus Fervidibacteria bacterium JGI MDM2 SSWTFF-3-K9]